MIFGLLSLCLLLMLRAITQFIVADALKLGDEPLTVGYGRTVWRLSEGAPAHRLALFPVRLRREGDASISPIEGRWIIAIAAGPAVLFGVSVASFATATFGFAEPDPLPIVGKVTEHSPAEAAGFQVGDKIVEIDGARIETFDELRAAIQGSTTGPRTLVVDRSGVRQAIQVKPIEGKIGVSGRMTTVGVATTVGRAARMTFALPFELLHAAPRKDAPPLATMAENIGQGSALRGLARLMALSVGQQASFLGFLLLLPFPTLDGWEIARTLLRVRRRSQSSPRS